MAIRRPNLAGMKLGNTLKVTGRPIQGADGRIYWEAKSSGPNGTIVTVHDFCIRRGRIGQCDNCPLRPKNDTPDKFSVLNLADSSTLQNGEPYGGPPPEQQQSTA